jgi:hypothetical protein
MARSFELDGDRWELSMEAATAPRDRPAIVFHCVSNPQRPYRVIELAGGEPASEVADEETVAQWFSQSHAMDYTHDPEGRLGQRPGESI